MPPTNPLDAVLVRKVTFGELGDMPVAQYIVAVLMAPMPDSQHTAPVASGLLDDLKAERIHAYWILSTKGKRVGVIAFQVLPIGVGEKRLYVTGLAFPDNAALGAWQALFAEGRQVMAALGCQYLQYDIDPDTAIGQQIMRATEGTGAKLQVRYTLEATPHGT